MNGVDIDNRLLGVEIALYLIKAPVIAVIMAMIYQGVSERYLRFRPSFWSSYAGTVSGLLLDVIGVAIYAVAFMPSAARRADVTEFDMGMFAVFGFAVIVYVYGVIVRDQNNVRLGFKRSLLIHSIVIGVLFIASAIIGGFVAAVLDVEYLWSYLRVYGPLGLVLAWIAYRLKEKLDMRWEPMLNCKAQEGAITCNGCGRENLAKDNFCSSCGKQMNAIQADLVLEKKKNKNFSVGELKIPVLVFLVVFLFGMIHVFSDESVKASKKNTIEAADHEKNTLLPDQAEVLGENISEDNLLIPLKHESLTNEKASESDSKAALAAIYAAEFASRAKKARESARDASVKGEVAARRALEAQEKARQAGIWNRYNRHGVIIKDKYTYEGELAGGTPNGYGVISFKNGEKYQGEWVGGSMQGYGWYLWPTGDKYSGQFLDNLKHGVGMYEGKSNVYEGEFKDDLSSGVGVFTSHYGWRYYGTRKDGKMQGSGILIVSSDEKYAGEWLGDKFSGYGVGTIDDGGWYSGEWTNFKSNGYGAVFEKNGAVVRQGLWRDGQFIK